MLSDNGAPIGDAREAEGSRRLASEEGEGSALKSDAEAVADEAFRQDSASTSPEPVSLPQSAEPAADKDAVAPAGAVAGAAAAETATKEAAAEEAHAHVGDGAPDAGDTGGANPSGGGHPAGNAARTSSNPPQTGDGDASQQQTAPAAPSSSTSARAMVPDEEDDENQPKHVTLQNYASRDSGAALLESSPASKGMANLLLDSKDKYAISPCEEKQWAVLGLSEDILVRTLVIGSHEKYSSLLKEFQVLASQTYPVHEWLDLGTFTAKFVQGEQTFEIPQPAFARYLKFKFLSHYGDEFYCTVSQVKVHGSTMLESFQHEWQQSSAEVREVQDFMKKKDPKPSSTAAAAAAAAATAARTPGRTLDSVAATDALPSQGSGTEGGGSDGAIGTNNTSPRTPGSAPRPSGAGTAPSNDGTVEHRPHAASAAAVSPGGKGGGGLGAGGAAAGGGSGTATVEDIVRGVPAEMVVPTTTAAACVGPTGSDGACRGEVLADRAAAQEAGGTAAGNGAPLGAEMPTMGGAAPSGTGKPDGGKDVGGGGVGGWAAAGGGDRGGNGDGTMDVGGPHARGDGVDVEGVKGAAAPPGSDGHVGDTQTAGGQQGPVEGGVGPVGRTEGGNKMNGGAMDGSPAAVAAGAGAQGSVSAGSGAGVGDVVAAGDEGYDGQGGGQEAPPQPRKGIIHSTMEAISKVVHRGEGSKLKDDDAAAAAANPGEATAAKISGDGEGTAAVSSGGSLEEDSKTDRPDPPDSTRVTAPATGGADGSGPVGDAGGELHTTGVSDSSDTAVESVGSSAAVSGDSAVRGDGSSAHGSAGGAVQNPGSPGDRAGANEGISAEAVPARVTEPVESGVSGVSNASSVSGADRAGEDARVEGGGAQRVEPDAGGGGGGGGGDGPVAERSNQAKQASAGSTSSPQPTDDQQQAQNTADATAAAADGGTGLGGADHAPPATAPPAAKDDGRLPSQAAATAAAATAGADVKARVQNTASIVVQEGGGSRDSGPSSMPVAPLDEASATELSAACLDAPSFSEFREEVLARTQQAQQSAGGAGGVAIGGQYESIFKTLMNKIKTLEINQSLFGLYIDDVHGCYQDVIAKMLQEQHRARASRSELLNAQTAHLAQIGDQWPAFQELQAKVIEVENRMLLSSLAWFTSLLCLVILVSSCCFKTFRRYALGGGSGDGGNGSRRGRRRKGACDSCSPSRGSATMCPESNGAVDTASPSMKETLHW